MPNMGYCRFENTLSDLQDCCDNLEKFDYGDLSVSEATQAEKLIELCRQIADAYDDEDIERIMAQYTEYTDE